MKYLFIILSFIFTTLLNAETRYLGFYNTEISSTTGEMNDASILPSNYFMNEDSTFIIEVIDEVVSIDKSNMIKKLKFWQGFNTMAYALGTASSINCQINNNAAGLATSYSIMNTSIDALNLTDYYLNDNENLMVSIIYTNNSKEEISIACDGYIWFILPGESIVFRGKNEMNMNIRVQFNLEDKHSVKRYMIKNKASLSKIKIKENTDEYIYFEKEIPSNSIFNNISKEEYKYYKNDQLYKMLF